MKRLTDKRDNWSEEALTEPWAEYRARKRRERRGEGDIVIEYEQALKLLEDAIEAAGGPTAYAKKLGVTGVFVANIRHGHQGISGKILEDLGLEKINAFRFKVNNKHPDQERYENSRKAYRESIENNPYMKHLKRDGG